MLLQWTTSANHDLVRLYAFFHPVNPSAAAQVVQQLVAAAEQLVCTRSLVSVLPSFHRVMYGG